jgi:hypothetical protein
VNAALEYANDGLRLWYDTEDAPVADGTLTMGARPAHPANTVMVYWRVDGRAIGSAPAVAATISGLGGDQYFRAGIPEHGSGALELLPVLRCSGRQTPRSSDTCAGSSSWFRYLAPPQKRGAPIENRIRPSDPGGPANVNVMSPSFSSDLEFLGTVTVRLRPPETIGAVAQGLRRTFYIISGACVGPRLNATIRPVGADWMLIQHDGVATPNVRTTWETPDGALLSGEYSGVFDLGPNGYENSLHDTFPDLPSVQLVPRLVTTHPRYLWLNRLQCVGIGVVDMKSLIVKYDLHAIGPSVRQLR